MRFSCALGVALGAALLAMPWTTPAAARLLIDIDKATQTMTVSQDGEQLFRWRVSTGTRTYATPSGSFTPFRMEEDHFSKEWDDAPMPHSIFFTKRGHAIHGTTHLRAIGRPASHGCVRLEPENARVLFGLVKREGLNNTRVVLSGETLDPRAPAMARRPRNDEQFEPRNGEPAEQRGRRYGQGPRYIERTPDGMVVQPSGRTDSEFPGDSSAGQWVQYPDGTRVFVRPRTPPPTLFWGERPYGSQ